MRIARDTPGRASVIRAVEGDEIEAGASEITLAEVLVKPLEAGATGLAKGYQCMMVPCSNFEVVPVGRDILVKTATLRARRSSIRPDAVHITTAQALSCGLFVGLPTPDGIRMLAVSPFTLDDILGSKPS